MKLIKKLYKTKILSFKGIFAFVFSLFKHGMNLMTLLGFAKIMSKNKYALKNGKQEMTYLELFNRSLNLASLFAEKFGVKNKQKIGVLCRNDFFVVESMFALSALGANVYFLNIDMAKNQLFELIEHLKLDFVVHSLDNFENKTELSTKFLAKHEIEIALFENRIVKRIKLKGIRKGDIVVLTGGTVGISRAAKRKASIKDYSNPFFAVLTELDLDNYSSIYIAPPLFHGFGLSSLMIAFLLGVEVYFADKFNVKESLEMIEKNKIEVVCLVPLMLQRMLDEDYLKLKSIKRVISGGAPISPVLVVETLSKMGDVLYNLFGTSEAGFSVMSNPQILKKHPASIGRPIRGVKMRIVDEDEKVLPVNSVGRIFIKAAWSMNNKNKKWVDTGDLAYKDVDGNLFLCGRADEMIVSGGENVFPSVLENTLLEHENIKDAAVIGVDDVEFGQRLKAFVVVEPDSKLSEMNILKWLKTKVARFEMPVKIEILEKLPYTDVGKLNKKILE